MNLFQPHLLRGSLLALALTASVAVAAELPALPQGLSVPKSATKLPAFSLPTAGGSTVRADESGTLLA